MYICETTKYLYVRLERKKVEIKEKSGNLYICETMGKKEKRTCKFKRTPVKQWKKGKNENLYTHR